jgi:hypothetical protein
VRGPQLKVVLFFEVTLLLLLLEDAKEFRVSGIGFRVWTFGFRFSGFGIRASGFGFRVSNFGLEFRVSGFRFQVSGVGLRVSVSSFGFSNFRTGNHSEISLKWHWWMPNWANNGNGGRDTVPNGRDQASRSKMHPALGGVRGVCPSPKTGYDATKFAPHKTLKLIRDAS